MRPRLTQSALIRPQSWSLADVLSDLGTRVRSTVAASTNSTTVTFAKAFNYPADDFFTELGFDNTGTVAVGQTVTLTDPERFRSYALLMQSPSSLLVGDVPRTIAEFAVDSYGSVVTITHDTSLGDVPLQRRTNEGIVFSMLDRNYSKPMLQEDLGTTRIHFTASGGL